MADVLTVRRSPNEMPQSDNRLVLLAKLVGELKDSEQSVVDLLDSLMLPVLNGPRLPGGIQVIYIGLEDFLVLIQPECFDDRAVVLFIQLGSGDVNLFEDRGLFARRISNLVFFQPRLQLVRNLRGARQTRLADLEPGTRVFIFLGATLLFGCPRDTAASRKLGDIRPEQYIFIRVNPLDPFGVQGREFSQKLE